MTELFNDDIIFSAYKKLKHYLYYDNTSLLIRQRFSNFETEVLKSNDLSKLKHQLFLLIDPIIKLDAKKHGAFLESDDTLGACHLSFHLLPKTFKKRSLGYITNLLHEDEIHLKRINIFIDASVEIHLISVLWLMYAGKYLTGKIGTHNYAYELQLNEDDQNEKIVDGLRLYKPYFIQYQKWRDGAISKAEDLLKDKKDVTILSLDIKDYFHSVQMDLNQVNKDIIEIIDSKIKKSLSEKEKKGYSDDKERVTILSNLLSSIHNSYKLKIQTLKPSLQNVSVL